MITDITRLSYWYPKLLGAGLPVPKTHIIPATDNELHGIWDSFDADLDERVLSLADRIRNAANDVGYPAFLRTDHFSGKHEWESTCYITQTSDITVHIINIAYFWECVNMLAPPCDVWAVREFLPTIPHGVCRDYGNMPICKEFRFFVDDSTLLCWHPYWPEKALNDGEALYNRPDFSYNDFCTPSHMEELVSLATSAGAAVGGKWSVDLLETEKGWYITDMAEAHKSWHWNGCQND